VLEGCHRCAAILAPAFDGMRVLLRGLQQCVRCTGSRGDPKLWHMMELGVAVSPQNRHAACVHRLLALAIEVDCSGLPHDPYATEWALTWALLHATGAHDHVAQCVCPLEELIDGWRRISSLCELGLEDIGVVIW
jgi:hypothetical protein